MTGGPPIDAYLRQVVAIMPGPARARRDILAELRSGLLDAADAHRSAGLPAGAAAEAAITEFGDPRQVADAFRPHLAMVHARRVALTLVATGPVVGLLWTAAALASHIAIRDAPPWQWPSAPPLSPAVFPAVGAALLIVAWSALATFAATGRLARWLPASPRIATATAATTGFGAAAADLAIIALLASQRPRHPRPPPRRRRHGSEPDPPYSCPTGRSHMPCHPRNPRLRTSPAESATPVLSPQAESAGRPWQLRIPWTSHHLKVLHEAGIITSERRGTWVYYRLEPAVLDRMGALLTAPVS